MRTMIGEPHRQLVLQVLGYGPGTLGSIARRADLTYAVIASAVQFLSRRGAIVPIGTAEQARKAGMHDAIKGLKQSSFQRKDARIWALAGTGLLPGASQKPVLEPDDEIARRAAERLGKRPSGSGQVAGPRRIGRGLAGWGGWGAR